MGWGQPSLTCTTQPSTSAASTSSSSQRHGLSLMDILPEYQRHEVAASHPGARGEGVCVLVHPDIAHGVGLWRSMPSAAGLWLVLKPAVTGAASDVYLGGVYIPPAQSALLRASPASDRFAALTEAASAASALGRVMIMGDFNARVAARSDIGDDHASSLLALRFASCSCLHRQVIWGPW